MTDVVGRSLGQQWLTTAVLSAFAIVSLLMATIGVYGVVRYGRAAARARVQRPHVTGAARRDVLRLVLRRGAVLAAGAPPSACSRRWLLRAPSGRCFTT